MRHLIRNHYFWLASITAVVGAIGAAMTHEPAGSGITESNFNRLVVGMTEEDVERVLGCPSGDYTDQTALNFRCGLGAYGIQRQVWIGRRITIETEFREEDGCLERMYYLDT